MKGIVFEWKSEKNDKNNDKYTDKYNDKYNDNCLKRMIKIQWNKNNDIWTILHSFSNIKSKGSLLPNQITLEIFKFITT